MTLFGRKCGLLLICLIALACIVWFTVQYKLYTAPDFVLVDRGGPEKPAYALSLHNEKTGYYRIECSSGCGEVEVNNTKYCFKGTNVPEKKQYNDYYTSTTMFLSMDDMVSASTELEDINFIVKFYYIKGET